MEIFDILTYIPILILIGMLVWFSDKEMRKSSELIELAEKHSEELKRIRLIRMNELAKAAEFGRLSQGLFHDLVTPLTSIVLNAEELKNTKAMEASRRMTAYIKDIRSTLAHEESDREYNLREELESVIYFLKYKMRDENVSIVIENDGVIWYGNPIKIRQIFLNLISNAIDSFDDIGDDHKKVISICVKNNLIQVKDNGSGIAPENLEEIFDVFYTTKPVDKGTGIGLATVKSIVEQDLKGKIKVESEVGKGTTFTITFPDKS